MNENSEYTYYVDCGHRDAMTLKISEEPWIFFWVNNNSPVYRDENDIPICPACGAWMESTNEN